MKKQPVFHPNAPKKLIRLWQKFPAYYRIAEHLQVNRGTVWLAMHEGREPINAETRVKFGLPRKPRKQPSDQPRTYKPDYLKWWNRLDKDIRNMYIKETFTQWSCK